MVGNIMPFLLCTWLPGEVDKKFCVTLSPAEVEIQPCFASFGKVRELRILVKIFCSQCSWPQDKYMEINFV